MKDEALSMAISKAGGVTRLAEALGITTEAVYQWERCPQRRVLAVVAATGGKVKAYQLRPDLYPAPAPRKRRAPLDTPKQQSAQP
ncbi:transcriptional regulator [Azospirillum sp. B510]|uniref:transcriptional regulator n=3 Tax=Alphaproteobacteria TaxID=28211 RepID=UPI000B34A2F6